MSVLYWVLALLGAYGLRAVYHFLSGVSDHEFKHKTYRVVKR